MTLISIDAGTTVVKAVLFDDSGTETAVARRETTIERRRPGFSEQDMDAVWEAVIAVTRELVPASSEPIEAITITGQGDGCWLVDAAGRPTGPAILWNDGRALPVIMDWEQRGILQAAARINGNVAFPGTSGPIMKWLYEHDRDRIDRSAKALHCTGFIFAQFTGELSVDETDATSPFLDLASGTYSPGILELFDMPWVERLLPQVRRNGTRVAELQAQAAAQVGLPEGLPVVIAPFDIPVTAIGIGAIDPGQACTILGTTLSSDIVLDAFDPDSPAVGMTLPSGVPGTFIKSVAAMAGVEILRWGMRTLQVDSPTALGELAATSPAGSRGLLFHPYLSPAGERAPFLDPNARGSFSGLSFEHTPADIARSLFEGMSYSIRHCLESSDRTISELRLSGGGANSDLWCQILADTMGIPTTRSTEAEIGAKGAFLVAQVALGREDDMRESVARAVNLGARFEPRPGAHEVHSVVYERFLDSLPDLAKQWAALADVRVATGATQ